jgi:hypothetical protein
VPPDRLLERLALAERTAGQRPRSLAWWLPPLPQQHLESPVAYAEDDGERDVRARIDHEF